MEALEILKAPVTFAKFIGHQLLGGAWAELPPLPQQGEIVRPSRVVRIPENIILGEE